MKRRQIRLYNNFFPVWILLLGPLTCLVVLPINFLIDLGVTVLVLKILKQNDIWGKAKETIWKTWILGFVADFAGFALIFLGSLDSYFPIDFGKWWYDNISSVLTLRSYNPLDNIFSFLWTLAAIGISALLIYIFNLKICLKKSDLDDNIKKKLALWLAIITAPYLFFMPAMFTIN